MKALLVALLSLLPTLAAAQAPWKGFAILGNGRLTAVYSDDPRIVAQTGRRGLQHLYVGDYAADYVAATDVSFTGADGAALERTADSVAMQPYHTARTVSKLTDGSAAEVTCAVHPTLDGVILSVARQKPGATFAATVSFRGRIVSDRVTTLSSLSVRSGAAVATFSDGQIIVVAPRSPGDRVTVADSVVTVTGGLGTLPHSVLILPARAEASARRALAGFRSSRDLAASVASGWAAWLRKGKLPTFPGADGPKLLEAYKRNLLCVKAATLNGQIPADITGQFVTNGMPQLYPRDAMMCARVFLLTGHVAEAEQVIRFWARPDIPQKSPGEWFARYDARAQAVDGGSGARYDEPEWDANGYFIQLLAMHETLTRRPYTTLVSDTLVYRMADFLVAHVDENGLLKEGGIVEWTGYLPATNMTCAAALRTAAGLAKRADQVDRAARYTSAAERIAANLGRMINPSTGAYADVRPVGHKAADNGSITTATGDTLYLWDTSANFGVLWGYPDHVEMARTNAFYQSNTVVLGGGMQYFDAPDAGLTSYGHGAFFFTTAAAAQYQARFGDRPIARRHIDWMLANANSYGLMPERIYLDGSDCSPASPLSWCSAEFVAALLPLGR